jgi:hypothetical protein
MHTDFENFLHKAEDHYLSNPEMLVFRHHVTTLRERLKTYEILRDQEVQIFQPIADQLLESLGQEQVAVLERALKQWIAILRYGAMAMLLNSPEYLDRHLLEWLTDIVKVHQMQAISQQINQLLQARLLEVLTPRQMTLLQPFLAQSQTTVLGSVNSKPVQV